MTTLIPYNDSIIINQRRKSSRNIPKPGIREVFAERIDRYTYDILTKDQQVEVDK